MEDAKVDIPGAENDVLPKKDPLPPTPPPTEDNTSENSVAGDDISFPLPPPTRPPVEILDVDKKTPDSHVPRDPRLIRLTGVHPFNVEAPLSDLFNEGFLTSPELFYVRNHGAVPQVKDEEIPDWEFSVEGLVEKPFTLKLSELIRDYEQVTYPVTLVCAGNRRKEQNQVRKSKGFSWGAAGVSTAIFTGVVMSDVVRKARPRKKARYVCMEGADALPNGNYETNVKLNWVMDPNRGIMLAYKMNGEMLRPDHGKPLRAVVPGQIGGRSVKWLKRLIVTEGPSDNWYHIYDNRLLPTQVSPEESANNPKWWMDERYAIYDLNTNSAVAYPAHEEQLGLVAGPETYRARGYAYGGAGRRVNRVEVSLNKGETWRLADIEYAEDRYRNYDGNLYGGRMDMSWRETCFCWCFWSIDLSVSEVADSKDIVVRAMDESLHVQPRDMYWSVLGMMNNPWFRVTISKEGDYLRFEHPTQPALIPGGWMERVKNAGGDLTNGYWGENMTGGDAVAPIKKEAAKEVPMVKDGLKNAITIDELRKHDKEDNPWFVVNGEVYDGTKFLSGHPGGAQSIVSAAGLDSTDEFMAIHSETAKAMMPSYHIGSLDDAAKSSLVEGESEAPRNTGIRPIFLQPRSWTKAVLSAKKIVSWDTRTFTFDLEHKEQTLGLPVGQHLMMRLRDPVTREAIIRSYTPISEIKDKSKLEMLVKVYFTKEGQKGGKMSQALDSLPIGHFVDFKGPIGKFEYCGLGECKINGVSRHVTSFVMICGGTGITPIFQVFRAIMQNPEDRTKCIVFNGNRLFEDILCKPELDALCNGNDHRARMLYTLTQGTVDWTGLRGRVTGALVKEHVLPNEKSLVLVCGPEAMEKSMHVALLEQGWSDEQLLFF